MITTFTLLNEISILIFMIPQKFIQNTKVKCKNGENDHKLTILLMLGYLLLFCGLLDNCPCVFKLASC